MIKKEEKAAFNKACDEAGIPMLKSEYDCLWAFCEGIQYARKEHMEDIITIKKRLKILENKNGK